MKNLYLLLCLFSIGIFSLLYAGCAGNRERESTTEETTSEAVKSDEQYEEMNGDIYVDIIAHQTYWSALYAEKMEGEYNQQEATRLGAEMAEKMTNLYREHGVTEDSFDEFSSDLMDDPENYMELVERISERVEELVEEN